MMYYLNLKSVGATSCLAFCLSMAACHPKINTTDTWDSTGKHTMPADSTFNKIDTSDSAHLVDTEKMMTDTSNR